MCLCTTTSLFQTSFMITGQSLKPLINKSLNAKALPCCSLQGVLHLKTNFSRTSRRRNPKALRHGGTLICMCAGTVLVFNPERLSSANKGSNRVYQHSVDNSGKTPQGTGRPDQMQTCPILGAVPPSTPREEQPTTIFKTDGPS